MHLRIFDFGIVLSNSYNIVHFTDLLNAGREVLYLMLSGILFQNVSPWICIELSLLANRVFTLVVQTVLRKVLCGRSSSRVIIIFKTIHKSKSSFSLNIWLLVSEKCVFFTSSITNILKIVCISMQPNEAKLIILYSRSTGY